MALLNGLEEMPIAYVHPAIECLELQEGLVAFAAGREWIPLHPFVNRFDQVKEAGFQLRRATAGL